MTAVGFIADETHRESICLFSADSVEKLGSQSGTAFFSEILQMRASLNPR